MSTDFNTGAFAQTGFGQNNNNGFGNQPGTSYNPFPQQQAQPQNQQGFANQGFAQQQTQAAPADFDFNASYLAEDAYVPTGPAFVVLEEGNYPFMIKDVKESRFTPRPGSDTQIPSGTTLKEVTCVVDGGNGNLVEIKRNLYITPSLGRVLGNFFASIGEPVGPNGQVKMNWNPGYLIGKQGMCHVSKDAGTQNPNRFFNNIQYFISPNN